MHASLNTTSAEAAPDARGKFLARLAVHQRVLSSTQATSTLTGCT